ncbi:MFS transporter [Bacillus sp. HU-1818]|uniref:MFS transporter n=1 Tax=Bacillus TaxID=1386 RepID=UPI000D04146C|nr:MULTISPECIES: MFS transporter [Bacillus]MBT2626999.1 MFS transporter [Bacillus sp. ISL-32]KAA6443861.1 MFS transporter [Bacillus atrophaeus]MCI3195916.1 MFS transporter [Bacillus sp. HU-1818]MCY9110883.1 MFS transporter [Bacillus atrophaeus]PRR96664.1 MFS transporter [Bacillus atrophaeus]
MNYMGRLSILMLNMFIAMLGIGLIIPIMPTYITEFGATGSTMGLLVAAAGLTQLLFAPIAGEITDKYGRRKLIIFGIASFAVSQIIFAFAGSLWQLFASRLLGGIGAAFLMPSMFAYIADITTEKERGKGMGLFSAAMTLGVVIGPGVGGYLIHYGIAVPFIVSASLACFSAILSFFFLPETLEKEKQLEARAKKEKRENLFQQMSRALKSPYAFMLILVFVLNFGIMNFESIFGLYVDRKHGFTASDIALIITAAGLVGVFVQAVAVSFLVGKFGEKKVINGTLIGAAAGLVFCSLAQSYWTVFAAAIFFMMLTSLLRPAVNTQLSKLAGDQQGFAGGMNTAFISLANIAGPSAAGFLFDVNIEFPYILGTVILLISFFAALNGGRKEQPRQLSQEG